MNEHLSLEAAREGYQLAEQENDRLRFMLAWCAQRLAKEHLPELVKMVREKTVADSYEDDREDYLKLRKHIERLTDLVQVAIDRSPLPDGWHIKADAAANQLRGYLDTELCPSLHEIRERR